MIGRSWVVTQRTTSRMVPLVRAATYSSGHSSSLADCIQKSAFSRPPLPATSVSPRAADWAPVTVWAARSGVHVADLLTTTQVGSKTLTSPREARRRWVTEWMSPLTLATMAAPPPSPSSSRAGTHSPEVLNDWDGPTMQIEVRGSVATSWPPTRPSTMRPLTGPGTARRRRSRRRAK